MLLYTNLSLNCLSNWTAQWEPTCCLEASFPPLPVAHYTTCLFTMYSLRLFIYMVSGSKDSNSWPLFLSLHMFLIVFWFSIVTLSSPVTNINAPPFNWCTSSSILIMKLLSCSHSCSSFSPSLWSFLIIRYAYSVSALVCYLPIHLHMFYLPCMPLIHFRLTSACYDMKCFSLKSHLRVTTFTLSSSISLLNAFWCSERSQLLRRCLNWTAYWR